jgi:hypothetical protein
MRSDEALQVAVGFSPKDLLATDFGINGATINASASLTSNWVNTRGYRRICFVILASKNYSYNLLGQVGSIQGTTAQRNTGTAQNFTGGVGGVINTFIFEICNDAIALVLNNTDATSGTFTVAATLLP